MPCRLAAALAGAVLLAGAPALAQRGPAPHPEEDAIRRAYAAIDSSVVHIRTIADIEQPVIDPLTGAASNLRRPLSVYGTGVVIGETFADGRWEYLVLTNHHVADVSNYVVNDGRFLRENKRNTRAEPLAEEETFLVTREQDEVAESDVRLIEVARDPRGDMALLRTVGATRELTPFRGRIGYLDGEVEAGAPIVTSGFPYTGGKVFALGRVLRVDRLHELGQPHEDFTVDLPVERGQSGSPVFTVRLGDDAAGETRVEFRLIGLLHAAEKGEKFMVPYALWKDSLDALPAVVAHRLAR